MTLNLAEFAIIKTIIANGFQVKIVINLSSTVASLDLDPLSCLNRMGNTFWHKSSNWEFNNIEKKNEKK